MKQDMLPEFQTRSEITGLMFFSTLREAFNEANRDRTIWKISFSVNGEPVRLKRQLIDGQAYWIYSDVMEDELCKMQRHTKRE